MAVGVEAHIVLILTVGLTFASFLGYFALRFKFSPILGYLLAGYLIGPFSPGFVADIKVAEQLAEIGVILMMFGVGLHFRIEDLAQVKKLSVPGGIGQVLVATFSGAILLFSLGYELGAGIVYGLAISVASTVVIVRVLSDNKLLNAPLGHIAVGWTIVEDIITIFILLLLPTLASLSYDGNLSIYEVGKSIIISSIKFIM
ncbi:MAG: cation:proton antiporter, partial [Parachlamydiaceae bacterium]